MFCESLSKRSNQVGTIKIKDVFTIVDNRGKTPPLSTCKTDYPIIDIRTLTSDNRNIIYENATKYVEKDIYENWFRSGHPKKYDILLSTVGTIGSMKVFNESFGCIAQNVVAFRCKNKYPLFYYQQLKSIQNNLISYDIGSVQPSIKISQIDKLELSIFQECDMNKFEQLSRTITEKIFNLYATNKKLHKLKHLFLQKFFGPNKSSS